MRPIRIATAVVLLVGIMFSPITAYAAVHLWQIKEVFSNADGTVQFIELFDTSPGETETMFSSLNTDSDGVMKSFPLGKNISGDTVNGHLLFATPGFGSLPGGVTPDFTLPNPTIPANGIFFNPNAANITITFTGSFDSVSFTSATLPKNGIESLSFVGPPTGAAINSPTNLSDATDSVNLGDYNRDNVVNAADYVVWRDTLSPAVISIGSGADGNVNGMIDDADYAVWRAHFGNVAPTSASASGSFLIPEPITPILMSVGLYLLALRRRR